MTDGKLHHNHRDLTGQTFGWLTALRCVGSDGKAATWLYRCRCGTEVARQGKRVTKTARAGMTPSCGCFMAQAKTHGMSKHPAYAVWDSMRARCTNPNHHAWHNYGGRGITVCARWLDSFETFWADMSPSYVPGHDLDRTNNEQGYSTENCRWVPRKVNALNKRGYVGVDIATLSADTGIAKSTLRWRLARGLPLTAPVRWSTSPTAARGNASS